MLFKSNKIKVGNSLIHGRGVFATDFIQNGEVLEECHFIEILEKDFNKIDKSIQDICYVWPFISSEEPGLFISHVIVLGFGSIYNHSDDNSAIWTTDIDRHCYVFKAIRDINPGEEILINYMKQIKF